MTVETFIEGLSRDEKLVAMEIIWRDLCQETEGVESPDWHQDVIRERLANPRVGDSLGLDEAKREIRARLNADRTTN